MQKPEDTRQTPWNKGKFIGSKSPLRTKDVWSIRTKLQVEKRTRDLAMFNLAIDSKLRGCDVVSLKVEDVAPHGITVDRATVRQRKTGRPVRSQRCETIGISGKGHNDQRERHCKQWSRVADTFQWLQAYNLIVPRGCARFANNAGLNPTCYRRRRGW